MSMHNAVWFTIASIGLLSAVLAIFFGARLPLESTAITCKFGYYGKSRASF